MFVVSYTEKKRKYYESLDIKKFLDNKEFWKTVIFCLIKTQSVCKLALEKSKIVSDDFDFYDLSKEFRAFFKNAVKPLNFNPDRYYLNDTENMSETVDIAKQKFENHPSVLAIK